jgi:mannobiose 2-epimerase
MAAAASEGFTPEGGMIYERTSDTIDGDRHWWVQAESVTGYFNLWDSLGIQEGLENALCCWEFIKAGIIDREGGEWFWSLRADDTVNREDDKAGFWKCPYHNGRMCLEIIERTSKKQNLQ